jgi:hypothetical protein
MEISGSQRSSLIVVSLALSIALSNAATPKPALRIPYVSNAPKWEDFVPGRESGPELLVADFRQRQPHDGDPASQPTAVYLSYDDKNLYAVFVCTDQPGKVRAHVSRRESISDDDTVGLLLDTFHDGRRAYMFFANPLGVQLDGIATEGHPDDLSFDTVWRSDGRLTRFGYIVRIAVPFKSLRFRPDGGAWGVSLTRKIKRNDEYSSWPYITDRLEAFVPQFGILEGLTPRLKGRNIDVIPYGFLAHERLLDDAGGYRARPETRGGLDAKAVLHNTLTLDVTVNPDFSQVESDEPQVTVNQRYEVFFPEKRPFFLENAGFFETPETLFFSRRIVDPQLGARLTGKIGPWEIGVLTMDDRAPGNLDGTGQRAHIEVGRIQREVGAATFGVTYESRQFEGGANQVISEDTRIKLGANWIAAGQVVYSNTRIPGDPTSSGSAWFGELRHSGRHLQYFTQYRDRSPEFAADLGFIPRVDIREVKNVAEYRWKPQAGWLLSYGPSVIATAAWNHAGSLQDWSVETPFSFDFKGPSNLTVSRIEAFERFRNLGFRKDSSDVQFSYNKWKWLGVLADYSEGRAVNYNPAAGLLPQAADSIEGNLNLTFRPTTRARFDETYFYTRLGSPGASVFTNHLCRSKLNYQFTRELSARVIVDYNAVLPNLSLTSLDRTKRFATDLLLTYLIHPGTALYVGYTDQRENFGFLGASQAELQRMGGPWLSTGRQFFVKISYLLSL